MVHAVAFQNREGAHKLANTSNTSHLTHYFSCACQSKND